MYLSPRKKLFVDIASEMFGNGAVISKQNVREVLKKQRFRSQLGL